MRRLRWVALGALALLAIAEGGLRLAGFAAPPLFVRDAAYQYAYRPNQDVQRMGNRVLVNALSMRSDEVGAEDCVAVLLVGDSVVSGGNPTDHDELASTVLDRLVRAADGKTRVLNASAGGWTVEHAGAYLREHGHFGARALVAVVNSADATSRPDPGEVAGVRRGMPMRRPVTALGEVARRYVWPRLSKAAGIAPDRPADRPADHAVRLPVDAPAGAVGPGWQHLADYAAAAGVPLVLYLHPNRRELANRAYSTGGRLIQAFADSAGIPLIDGMDYTHPDDYRDSIHLSGAGQQALVRGLSAVVVEAARACRGGSLVASTSPVTVRLEAVSAAGGTRADAP